MKIICRLTLFLSLILTAAFPAAGTEFCIKIAGGFSLFHPDAINRSFQDWVTWKEKNAAATKNWNFLSGEAGKFTNLFSFEGELLFSLRKNIAFSFGTGYLYGEVGPEKTHTFIQRPLGLYMYNHPAKVTATPVIFSGYYKFPLFNKFGLFIKAGAGLVWAKFIERDGLKKTDEDDFRYPEVQNSSAKGPLFTAGLGFIYETENGLDFFLESSWRQAKITDFKGEISEGETGTLYYVEAYDQELDYWQAKHLVLPEEPAGTNFRAIKKAQVNFSGFTFKLGIMIRF